MFSLPPTCGTLFAVPTATRHRAPTPDAACAEAVELAQAAAVEEAGHPVGEHLGVAADAERVVTHFFDAREPAYLGWRWAVTVARASRARLVTVDEVVLLPGDGALLAPDWLPWSERLRPGDLGVGDLLVTSADDERLAPAYAAGDDPDEEAVAFELGRGRVRVLSLDGRDEAAERWYDGDRGPLAPIAKAAPAPCATCAFLVPLAGPLGRAFGVCGNEYAPDDAMVVSTDHGCGGHSEAIVVNLAEPARAIVDDYAFEVLAPAADTGAGAGAETDAGPGDSVADDESGEALGHS